MKTATSGMGGYALWLSRRPPPPLRIMLKIARVPTLGAPRNGALCSRSTCSGCSDGPRGTSMAWACVFVKLGVFLKSDQFGVLGLSCEPSSTMGAPRKAKPPGCRDSTVAPEVSGPTHFLEARFCNARGSRSSQHSVTGADGTHPSASGGNRNFRRVRL